MIPAVRCFLLDLGRVLVDLDLARLASKMQALTGLGPVELRAAFTGDGLVARYETGRMSDQEFHKAFCSRTSRQISYPDFASAWNEIFVPGQILSDETISRLAGIGDLWIISNTNPIHFGYVRQNHDFLRYFQGYILSYEVGSLKPDPAIYEAARARTGINPSRTLFVDDQLSHVEAARKLGFHAIQFTRPSDLDPILQQ
jgi:glucose-1-phosphatase